MMWRFRDWTGTLRRPSIRTRGVVVNETDRSSSASSWREASEITVAARADSRVQYLRQSPCVLKEVVPVKGGPPAANEVASSSPYRPTTSRPNRIMPDVIVQADSCVSQARYPLSSYATSRFNSA